MVTREKYKLAYGLAKKYVNSNACYAAYESRVVREHIPAIVADNAWLSMCHMRDYDACGKRYRFSVEDKRHIYHGGPKKWREFCHWFYTREV